MDPMTRRSFLQLSARLAAVLGLARSAVPALAETLAQLANGTAPVLWLQGQSCSGCSVSLLNSDPITPSRLLTQYLSLVFHQTLSSATGQTAVDVVNRTIDQGGYILLVEGAVPATMPRACMFADEPFTTQLTRAARQAKAVVAVGACAAHGGIPATENNPTGSIGAIQFLETQGVKTPIVSVPGCPVHPDWLVGTVAHVLRFGLPPLDALHRPTAFYGRLVHDQCPRFPDYEREVFAKTFSDEGCMFHLGCLGPITHADCTVRSWNGGINNCIRAGAPCAGCASELFGKKADFPFLLNRATGKAPV